MPLSQKIILFLGLIVLASACGGALYFKNQADALAQGGASDYQEPLKTVDVYSVAYLDRPLVFQKRGATKGIQEIMISSEVEGRVISCPIKEGQSVEAGALLCRIDTTFYEIAVESARSQYDEAKAAHETARVQFDHVDSLAEGNRTPLEYELRKTQYDRTLAAVAAAKSVLDQAKQRLARCHIVSPVSGVVAAVAVDEGELIHPMAPVAEVVNLSQLRVVVSLADTQVAQLGTRPRIEIHSPAFPSQTFRGRWMATYPKADPLTRRIPIEILVDNPDRRLRSGTLVNCLIESEESTRRLLVPSEAVLHDFGTDYCFLAAPGDSGALQVKRQNLQTLPVPDSISWTEVLQGITPGDMIIVAGQRELHVGERVATRAVTFDHEKLADQHPTGTNW